MEGYPFFETSVRGCKRFPVPIRLKSSHSLSGPMLTPRSKHKRWFNRPLYCIYELTPNLKTVRWKVSLHTSNHSSQLDCALLRKLKLPHGNESGLQVSEIALTVTNHPLNMSLCIRPSATMRQKGNTTYLAPDASLTTLNPATRATGEIDREVLKLLGPKGLRL